VKLVTLQQLFLRWPLLTILFSGMLISCAGLDPTRHLTISETREIHHYNNKKELEKRQMGIAHFRAGKVSFAQGQMSEAFSHFSRASQMVPNWDLPYLELAILHPLWDNDKQAEMQALENAMKINPMNPRSHLMLGSVLIQLEKYEEAEKSLRKALELKKEYQEANLRLANLYKRQKLYDKAARQYNILLSNQKGNAFLHSILAHLYEELGAYDKAEKQLRHLIAFQPNAGWVFHKLGKFYERTGKLRKAKAAYKRAEELNPAEKKRTMRPMLPSRK